MSADLKGTKMKLLPKKIKSRLKPLVQKLLLKCMNSNTLGQKFKLEDIQEIYADLQEIQKIESDYVTPVTNRNSLNCWDDFYSWCSQHGSEFSAVKIEEISGEDHGLVAVENINEYQEFLTVTKTVMMTEESAAASKLGPLIAKDPLLQHMPNIQLSLHLIVELLNPYSFWKPYISILPSSYNTILYFTIDELKELQGSLILNEVFKMYCNVARQYCYFFQLFQNNSLGRSLNIGQYFTYDLYRWAVSTVMTRQNAIPSVDEKSQAALIPFFDMCNHTNGKLSTDFNLEKDALVSYAIHQFSKGEEVLIFYGPRTNADFFLHNGFVYAENENDAIEIKLGISKNDSVFSLKSEVFEKLGFELQGTFKMRKKEVVSDKLLVFLKVNVMKADELKNILRLDVGDIHETLMNSSDLARRAFAFLKDRTYLLLRSYKTTNEEDESIISSDSSRNRCLAHELLLSEKKILNHVYNYCVDHSHST